MKKQENSIHLKFDYSEAINGKKDILSSEINILNIINIINNYKKLRNNELKNKLKIKLKIKSLRTDLIKIEKFLPKIKIPKILKKEHKKLVEENKSENFDKYGTVEEQLRLIQRNLKNLEQN